VLLHGDQFERIGDGAAAELTQEGDLIGRFGVVLLEKALHGGLREAGDSNEEKGPKPGASVLVMNVGGIYNGGDVVLLAEGVAVRKMPASALLLQTSYFQAFIFNDEGSGRPKRALNSFQPLHVVFCGCHIGRQASA
jgi:hypothetical protein